MTLRYRAMNQHDALYTLAREYPGGVEALAMRLGMTANVLRNKLRPTISSHHITSEEESLILELCEESKVDDWHWPLMAKNKRHGLLAYPLPDVANLSTTELTQAMCRAVKEFSDLATAASAAMADGHISQTELDTIQKEGLEAIAAIAELGERMRQRAEQAGTEGHA